MARVAGASGDDNPATGESFAQSIELAEYPDRKPNPALPTRDSPVKAGRSYIYKPRVPDWETGGSPGLREQPPRRIKYWAEALRCRSLYPGSREKPPKMKFSHSLQFNAVPDWSAYYIAYSNLKKLWVLPLSQASDTLNQIEMCDRMGFHAVTNA